jgi:hypothetical protein
VCAPLAAIVDRLAVGEERATQRIERGPALVRQVVDDQRCEVLAVRGAGGQVDQRAQPRHRIRHAECTGRVRRRRRNPAEGRAGADRDGRCGRAAHLARDVECRRPPIVQQALPAPVGIEPPPRRSAALLFDDSRERLLGLVARRRHDRLVIVDREQVEHDSAAVGRPARRNDSVLPAQSWNSSQTSVGFSPLAIASAIFATALRGSANTPP